jgi:hypothetical protein
MRSGIVNDWHPHSLCIFRAQEKFALRSRIDHHKAVDEREVKNGTPQLFANSTCAHKFLHTKDRKSFIEVL